MKSCTIDECDRGAQARGMCSSHYSVWHRRMNGRKKHAKVCEFCGADYATTSRRSAFCSERCAKRDHYGWSRSKEIVHSPRSAARPSVVVVPPNRKRWFACVCRVCGAGFIDKAPYTHCSDSCRRVTRRAAVHAQKASRGEFSVSDSARLAIYERDGWTCQLCGVEVSRAYSWSDPLSPTLDHIIPQSLQSKPDHSASNLRLAHALCNSVRGNREGVSPGDLRRRVNDSEVVAGGWQEAAPPGDDCAEG